MNRSLERKIALGFVTAVAAVLATGVAAWMNARRVDRTIDWVSHTHDVRYHLESTLVQLLIMQTAVRGYLLTGEAQFLGGYERAVIDGDDAIERAQRLTTDNPGQQARLAELELAIEDARAAFRTLIAARQEQGLRAAEDSSLLDSSRNHVRRARGLVIDLDAEEQRLLAERSATSRRAIANVARIVLLTVLLATVALAVTLRYGLRDYRLRVRVERELADFFRLSLDPLCVVSPDGKFVRLNPAWEAVLGYPLEQMAGRPFLEFVHPDDVDRTNIEARRVAGGEETVSFRNRYRARDGSWRWLEWNASAVPTSGQIMAVARDITSRKQDEDRIAELNDNLQAQNTELEAFSYSVSHDLRAPLRHMTGFAALLTKHAGASLDDKGRHYINAITAAAETMGRLIDDLLQFSRTARAPLVPQAVDHNALVQEHVQHAPGGATNIEWQIAPLPTTPGDPALLRQVWANYLSNAAKYSAKAQPHPIIAIDAKPDQAANEMIFSVRDNGVGFDPRYANRLFNVFSRLHDSQEFEGTGIGLALVRRIIARHGGRTWAESQPGKGAVFYFSLPLQPVRRNADLAA